ncbi:MAG: hypothetical protein IJ253_11175 [Bacteroidaceae bacterium]|nr:hypothetical protein [Bacteroidaceae bacterium]
MKRLAYLPMLLSLLLGSCTLMMEDIDTEEEEKVNLEEVGFDEPYTQKTEFGDVTFQYGDSTRVLHQEAMNYLVKVEGDSILYFTDNIPRELLVPVGQYVSMGCNEHLRRGLCSQVISLTQENGMYRMVTSRRPNSAVFKQLDVDVNFDYVQGMYFDTQEYLEEQGMINENGDTDSIFTDWSLMGQDIVERKEAEVRRRIRARYGDVPETRWSFFGKDEEVEEGDQGDKNYKPTDLDKTDKTSKDVKIFGISTKRMCKLFDVKRGTGDWKGSLEVFYHEETTIHHIQKVSNGQDYLYDSYDESASIKAALSIGWENSLWSANETKTLKSAYNKLYDAINDNWYERVKKNKKALSCSNFMIHIPLPIITAVEFFVRVEPKVDVSIELVGELEVTKQLTKIHKEVEYQKGELTKKIYKAQKETNNKFTVTKFDLYGSFGITASVEALTGFATTGGSFGLGIGAEVGMKYTIGYHLPLQEKDGGSFSVYLKPKIRAFAQSPAGKEWLGVDTKIPGVPDEINLLGPVTVPIAPTFDQPKGSFTLNEQAGEASAVVKATFRIADLNALDYVSTSNYEVIGRFFREEAGKESEWVGDALPQTLTSKIKQAYNFTIEDADYKAGCYYIARPFIRYKPTKDLIGDENSDVICKLVGEDSEYPILTFQKFYQIGFEKTEDDYENYAVRMRILMNNLEKQANWQEWGVELEVKGYFRESYDGHKKGDWRETLLERTRFPVRKQITKNNILLTYKLETPGDEDIEVEALVYYIDKNGDIHYVHMRDVNKENLRLTSDMDDWETDTNHGNEQAISIK